jgi:hypothetical protein
VLAPDFVLEEEHEQGEAGLKVTYDTGEAEKAAEEEKNPTQIIS